MQIRCHDNTAVDLDLGHKSVPNFDVRKVQAKEADILETLQLLCARHALSEPSEHATPTYLPATHRLARLEAAMRSGGVCDACGTAVRMVVVTPCAHMLCAGCASSDSTACVASGCGVKYKIQAIDDPERCEMEVCVCP